MKLLIALLLFVPAQAALVEYEVFQSDSMQLQIEYPAEWNVIRIGLRTLHITPAKYEEWRRGGGRAPAPLPWVEITGAPGEKCPEYTPQELAGYVPALDYADRRLGFREYKTCKNGIRFAFSVWDRDPKGLEHRKVFEYMIQSVAAVVP